MIKTAIENKQNLIVEGCYIPFDYDKDFESEYLKEIKYVCLIMSEKYILNHFGDIKNYANIIEKRLDDSYLTQEMLIEDNKKNLSECKKYGKNYILIDENYEADISF